ncbi:MAG TPA: MBL fold metallo-hydrolase [Longimicrobiales bacterium]|nr:MBL fold metallo-hydrolase [Longimicrobiales bacterium]
MRLHFLGTGTSFGVPVVGCRCATCTSDDPRDRRTRHGAVLEHERGTLLVDTPPELREQLVRAGISRIDAVWFTHDHADHTHGIDDLRVFSVRLRQHVEAHADAVTAASLRRKFQYIFDESYQPPEGTSKPEIRLHEFAPGLPVLVAGRELLPLAVPHGDLTAYGFRCGSLGYITDAKRLSEEVQAALAGVRVLVLNALWFGHPHPTHFNVEEAVATARRIGAERTFLTHLTHRVRHAQLCERLPDGILPAHDGLVIDIPEP